jgi:two-component system, OmpR family, response regulator QseB
LKILLVEDDELIASGLQIALGRLRHRVEWSADGQQAQRLFDTEDFDLVILDLGLPGKDGFDILSHLRQSGSAVSVLILSARDGIKDRVKGLDLGADDYLTKPFDLDELLARVRVLERRRMSSANHVLENGRLTLDLNSMTVTWDNQPVELPRREWMLLRLFVENPQRVYTRSQIEDALYGWSEETESNAIDVHVHHLRKKFTPDLIKTIRGIGYRLGEVA